MGRKRKELSEPVQLGPATTDPFLVRTMSGNKKPQTFRNCAFCRQRFGPLSSLSTRFCSMRCKGLAQRDRPSPKKGQKYPHLRKSRVGKCLTCGHEYRAKSDHGRRRQKYCSHPCYMRSRAETSIEMLLREAFGRAGVNARAQVRIGRFTVDFLIADRIVVEADGDYWHAKPEVAAKDRRKDAWLSGHGYKIIHVSEKEILSSVDKIVARMELVAR